jgi:16S rRNA (guanine(966)-N(2))-methyltransferase RsmD
MRASIRIVAGTLRGRKLNFTVSEELRPTPQRVREAYFSILGNAIPGRGFVDLFAGTGVMGLEALSRGASSAIFIERDQTLSKSIESHLRAFELMRQAKIFRTDTYRWIAAWRAPAEPVNVFLSPPFADLTEKRDDLVAAVQQLQAKVAEDSLIVVQSETGSKLEEIEPFAAWELRRYGRNELLIWQREITANLVQASSL